VIAGSEVSGGTTEQDISIVEAAVKSIAATRAVIGDIIQPGTLAAW
jgi:hypothetical protein